MNDIEVIGLLSFRFFGFSEEVAILSSTTHSTLI